MIKKICVFFLCIMLSGCIHKDNTVKLKFSTWGSVSEMKILEPIIKDFEKENPNIKIELLHIPQDYYKKLHLLFASNLAPDVILINNLNLPVYANFLENIDNTISKKEYYNQSINSLSTNGHLYAVPRDTSTLVIYYNKDIFNKNKVPYPRENWSLADLYLTSKKLTSSSHWGISFEPNIYYALPYMHYFNGGIYNNNGIYIGQTKNSKKGVEEYKNFAYKYKIAPTVSNIGSKTVAQLFLDEQIAMHLSGRWLVPKYREVAKFDWDVVNFPKYAAPVDSTGWAIAKTSKHKHEAKQFILFLSKRENIIKMTESGLIVPARIDVAESPIFLDNKPKSSFVFINSVKNSKNTNVTKDYNKITDELNDCYFNSVK